MTASYDPVRLHLVGLPHTQIERERFSSCAFTENIASFCEMMRGTNVEIILYGNDKTEQGVIDAVSEHVPIITEDERVGWFGKTNRFDPVPLPLRWEAHQPYWQKHTDRTIRAIRDRKRPKDIIAIVSHPSGREIEAAFPDCLTCEWSVGYEGSFADRRAFPSYAWMHETYGRQGIVNGRPFDAVIPHFFDPARFVVEDAPKRGDHLIYVGRLIGRKGVEVLGHISRHSGRKVLIAGSGCVKAEPGRITYSAGVIEGDVEYLGILNHDERNRALAAAAATIVPSAYLEPFGKIAVESMLCGTPVVASDWGAFPELVTRTVGRRARTLRQWLQGIEEATKECGWPTEVRRDAASRFGYDTIRPLYQDWFDSIQTLWGAGWPELPKRRTSNFGSAASSNDARYPYRDEAAR